MSISLPDTKTKAPHQLIQSKNYNECDFLMSMISEHCKLGTGFVIARNVVKLAQPVKLAKEKQTCEDISLILEKCILDGHDCKNNLYKFNVLCKGDVDTKL
jgi:hypothetical protein